MYTVPVLVQFGYCIHALQKLSDLEHKLKEADANLLSRDRLISELRLRMPATAERDAAIAKATANAQYQEEQYETKQALRVAQSTIGSLQSRITQKEQTISKLQVQALQLCVVCKIIPAQSLQLSSSEIRNLESK